MTLEERISRLEKLIEGLLEGGNSGRSNKDWRSTIGMFDGDAVMKEILDEAKRIREEDRRRIAP